MANDDIARLIGERVRTMREQRQIPSHSLATNAHIRSTSLSHIEAGDYAPGAGTLLALAVELGTTTDYLLGRTDDPAVPGDSGQSLSWAWRQVIRRIHDLPVDDQESIRQMTEGAVRLMENRRGR